MRRLFLTVRAKRCAFGCVYCFADFSQYNSPPSLDEVESGDISLDEVDVIYPACDVDLFAMRNHWLGTLERSAVLGRSISISTKAALQQEQINTLSLLARKMRSAGLVLKIGVSASTMLSCEEFEPRASSWPKRMDTLARLDEAGISTCLVLKPVLPDVAIQEYQEMLAQAAHHCSAVVLGDEYVDDDRDRRRSNQCNLSESLSSRRVRWLSGTPHWLVREAGSRLAELAQYAESCNIKPYFSDLHYMEDLIYALNSVSSPSPLTV